MLGLAAAAMVPAVSEALGYVREAEEALTDPSRPGNLLGAVPWQEVFNIWFAYDYRVDPATYEGLSAIGAWLGAAFAAVGVGFALHRRELALPLIVASGAIAAVVISIRYTIYLEAKGYAILAPALAIAAAAAVLCLLARPGAARAVGAVGAVLLVEGVLASAAFVYAGAWVTPKERFERDRRDRGPLPRPGADPGRRARGVGHLPAQGRAAIRLLGLLPAGPRAQGRRKMGAPAPAHAGFRRLLLGLRGATSRCCSSGRAPAAAVHRPTTGSPMRRRTTASGGVTARRRRTTCHWAATATTTPGGSIAAVPKCAQLLAREQAVGLAAGGGDPAEAGAA